MRQVLGAVLGIAVAIGVIFAVELIGHALLPVPTDYDPMTESGAARYLTEAPLAAKLALIGGWFFGALAGGWVAVRIGARAWLGWLVAGVIALACVANFMMIAHPMWMQVAGIALPLLAGWLASRTVPARRTL